MRYTQIRAFHYVALTGGFSRAADRLQQSQPSVSEQVRRLEVAHDVLLFDRTGRRVKLTDAGNALFALTQSYFEMETAIAAHLDQSRAALEGQLRIVADSAVHVTAAIGRFRVSHPKVAVSLWSGNTEEVLERLRSYEAEIGVVGNIGHAPDLDQVPLGDTPIVAIAAHGLMPRGHASIDIRSLDHWPLVMREPGSRTRAKLENAAAKAGVALKAAITVEGREAMREVVASGAGLGYVSKAEFGHDSRLRQIALTGAELGMAETLVTLRARSDVPVIRAFLKALT